MKGVVADTSVWIDFFNGKNTWQVDFLIDLIENDSPVFLTPVILQELLQGFVREKDFLTCKEILLEYPFLHLEPVNAAIESATLYRKLRKKGVTIRKSNDCLIAWYAIAHKVKILHKDRDFDVIARHSSLQTVLPPR